MTRKLLQSASLLMLAVFFIVVTLIGGATLFGSSKVRPLFGGRGDAFDALAGDGPAPRPSPARDAGAPPDAATPPHFFPPSKAGPLPGVDAAGP